MKFSSVSPLRSLCNGSHVKEWALESVPMMEPKHLMLSKLESKEMSSVMGEEACIYEEVKVSFHKGDFTNMVVV